MVRQLAAGRSEQNPSEMPRSERDQRCAIGEAAHGRRCTHGWLEAFDLHSSSSRISSILDPHAPISHPNGAPGGRIHAVTFSPCGTSRQTPAWKEEEVMLVKTAIRPPLAPRRARRLPIAAPARSIGERTRQHAGLTSRGRGHSPLIELLDFDEFKTVIERAVTPWTDD